MRIVLERTPFPEDLGDMADCALCGRSFEIGVVFPMLLVGNHMDAGSVCTACIEFMGHHPSGRFPTIEEYRRLEAEWGTPLYTSLEEADKDLGF
jgi:hypothetical protein